MTPIPNYLSTYQLHQSYYSLFGEYDGAGGVEKRGKERLKMGGKEEKRGACRGESLIICLPIPTTTSHFRSTINHTTKCGNKEKRKCGNGEQSEKGEVE